MGDTTERGIMCGHKASFEELWVLHLARGSTAARLEKMLIQAGMDKHARKCKNAVADSRGLVRSAPNFIYIATR